MGYTKEHESLLCSSMSTHLILIVVVIYLLFAAKQSLKNRKSRISFRYLRPRHFLRAFVALVLVVLATALLLMPKSALRWGWWSAIGGSGNVILGQTANSVNSAASILISIGIVVLVMSILSQAAFNEEIIFRYGDEHRPFYKRLRRSIVFGLEHMIMGIPLGGSSGANVWRAELQCGVSMGPQDYRIRGHRRHRSHAYAHRVQSDHHADALELSSI